MIKWASRTIKLGKYFQTAFDCGLKINFHELKSSKISNEESTDYKEMSNDFIEMFFKVKICFEKKLAVNGMLLNNYNY